MVFGAIVSSSRGALSALQALELANVYLEGAFRVNDSDISLVLCSDAEVSLSQAKKTSKSTEDKAIREGIATAYLELGKVLETRGHQDEAQASYKKGEKMGIASSIIGSSIKHQVSLPSVRNSFNDASTIRSITQPKQSGDIATIPQHIFAENVRPSSMDFKPPKVDSRLKDTPQLACCLSLLQGTHSPDEILEPTTRNWLSVTRHNAKEQERLKILATDVVRAFKRDDLKESKVIAEIVYLTPALEKDEFRYLFKEFYSGIDQSGLLDVHQLEGLAQLMQGADPGYLDADDLVKVLKLVSVRLQDTRHQSQQHIYQLALAVSHVLDTMADTNVKDLNRENGFQMIKHFGKRHYDTAETWFKALQDC
ncbi:hypothetical protein BGZ65_010866 [Modicella reniformis]|uniref:Arm-like repeat domain-containing protein n=1 Tax=Modicella reniformis TaxID=1440133 RepID=A0A9P6MAM7_9FUNG|nr:hypothetical protein BGZ65_010866 [Modicella reniformis]